MSNQKITINITLEYNREDLSFALGEDLTPEEFKAKVLEDLVYEDLHTYMREEPIGSWAAIVESED